MLCLSGFVLYSRWVPLVNDALFLLSLAARTLNHFELPGFK